ncbi:GTP-binding translation elongation factor TYPA [Mycobacteroides abscessus subsp. abscessus]|nr:GTP-binding translation elongation factor TYPA [Mycobacteroides abscessus subsp. abscessus]
MTIGINTSPLAGRNGGTKLTARLLKARLDQELVGNVSLRVLNTDRPDTWEVQGRGELALAILVETMRREGFELTVGKPQVVTRMVDGKVHEPFEELTIDVPEEHLGAVTQLLAARKGKMVQMTNQGHGWVRMEFIVPSRGLIGFRTDSPRPAAPASPTPSRTATRRGRARSAPGTPARWCPTARAASPPTRCCSWPTAAPSSWSRARRPTRAWSSASIRARKTSTSTSPARRS